LLEKLDRVSGFGVNGGTSGERSYRAKRRQMGEYSPEGWILRLEGKRVEGPRDGQKKNNR